MIRIIVDGYNVIRRDHRFGTAGQDNDLGRRHFLKAIYDYSKNRSGQMIVVFDGTYSDHARVEEYNKDNLKVLFSAFGQTADQLIVELAKRFPDSVIVSSDSAIASAVKRIGCGVLSSDDFIKKLNFEASYKKSPFDEKEDRFVERKIVADKKGPRKKRPKAERRALSKLSKF